VADKVLITGGAGALASDLSELLEGSCELSVRPRTELDVTDDVAVRAAVDETGAELVFNCAAFHNVDLCETEEEQALRVNATAVKRLAEACTERDAKLVHVSTNYVFDGRRAEPYREEDLPSPRSAYAISKGAGEQAALAYCPGALVIRTAGLYGLHGSAVKGGNFVQRVLGRARDEGKLTMVADQRLSPTFTADLARSLLEAVDAGADGLLHLTNDGSCSWFEFTEAILENAGVEADMDPVDTAQLGAPADRPLNGVLARGRADELGLTPLRHWRDALDDYMERSGLAKG
jgi:dTDP-4-dehydrorhamnose reductase